VTGGEPNLSIGSPQSTIKRTKKPTEKLRRSAPSKYQHTEEVGIRDRNVHWESKTGRKAKNGDPGYTTTQEDVTLQETG